jgi:hypothetical protein
MIYIISYEFASEVARDAWVSSGINRSGYKKDGAFIGIDWYAEMTDEEYEAEATTIGNNEDSLGRTGRRDVIKLVDDKDVENALNRGLTETAIQYGVYLSTQ